MVPLALLCALPALASDSNITLANYSSVRLQVSVNGVFSFYLDPNETKELNVPWDQTQTFTFTRTTWGKSNTPYEVKTYLGKFHDYEKIPVYDKDVP